MKTANADCHSLVYLLLDNGSTLSPIGSHARHYLEPAYAAPIVHDQRVHILSNSFIRKYLKHLSPRTCRV